MYKLYRIKLNTIGKKNVINFTSFIILFIAFVLIQQQVLSIDESANKQNNNIQNKIPSWKNDFPDKLRNLKDLNIVIGYKGENSIKCGVLLTWLAKERKSPSESSKGTGGGEIDSGYIQSQIIKCISENPDYTGLKDITTINNINSNLKDAIIIALGKNGDITQEKELIRILVDSKDPDYRALAAISLGYIGSNLAIPYLKDALEDKFNRKACNCVQGEYLEYTVKDAAETALRMINNEKRKDKVEKLKKKYNDKLEKEKNDNKTHKIQLDESVYNKNDK